MTPPDQKLAAVAQRLTTALDDLRQLCETIDETGSSRVKDEATRLVDELRATLGELLDDLGKL